MNKLQLYHRITGNYPICESSLCDRWRKKNGENCQLCPQYTVCMDFLRFLESMES